MQATSNAAHKTVKERGMKQKHYDIIEAKLRSENRPLCAMEIASLAQIDYWAVSRRTGEMVANGVIYVVDRKGTSRTGMSANRYALTQKLDYSDCSHVVQLSLLG